MEREVLDGNMMSLICYSCEIIISMINFLLLTVPSNSMIM